MRHQRILLVLEDDLLYAAFSELKVCSVCWCSTETGFVFQLHTLDLKNYFQSKDDITNFLIILKLRTCTKHCEKQNKNTVAVTRFLAILFLS